MPPDKIERNTPAMIGRIVAVLAAILSVIVGFGFILDLDIITDIPVIVDIERIYTGIIAILVAIVVFILESDRLVFPDHFDRGAFYVIIPFLAAGSFLLLIAGICYIIAALTI